MLHELANIDDVELAQDSRPWNPDKITWAQKEGNKGPYEKSVDTTNPDYQLLAKALKDKGGRFRKDGFFYWLFDQANAIGRKKV